MLIKSPCIITPRLLAGLHIGDGFLSIEYDGETPDGRQRYMIHLDAPGIEYSDDSLASGVGGGSLQEGLSSCLGFMGACAESRKYSTRTGRQGENSDLFPNNVGEWCEANDDAISLAQCELEETPDAISECP